MRRSIRFLRPIAALVSFWICGLAAGAPVQTAASPESAPATRPATARVVELKKLVIRVPARASVGTLSSGFACLSEKPLTPATGRALLTDGDLGDVFREEFAAVGYTVAGDPNDLFDEDTDTRPDYLVAGIVRDVKANLCTSGPGGATARAKGEASLSVDWQIYSLRTRKVEFTMTSSGAARLGSPQDGGGFEVFRQAFRGAARHLLATARLREVLDRTVVVESKPPVEEPPIVVAFQTQRNKLSGQEDMLSDARLSVVTIVAADAFGSGFLISTDGYLLTNQHVVGNARYVIARFVTGREVHGEVIRTNAERDIALVKLESDRYRPLPLGNTSALKPGTDVFAIGTPLFEEFGQTISKGIVSGFGENEGQRLIRSDVGIHKGSSGGPLLVKSGQVVGVAVEGVILPQIGVGVGLNSFIPIEEAIETLRLRNPDATAKPRLEVASQQTAPAN